MTAADWERAIRAGRDGSPELLAALCDWLEENGEEAASREARLYLPAFAALVEMTLAALRGSGRAGDSEWDHLTVRSGITEWAVWRLTGGEADHRRMTGGEGDHAGFSTDPIVGRLAEWAFHKERATAPLSRWFEARLACFPVAAYPDAGRGVCVTYRFTFPRD